MEPSPRGAAGPGRRSGLDLLRREHLPALILAGLQINVMRPAELAGILVLDIGRRLQRIGGTAHAPAGRRGFLLWSGHGSNLLRRTPARNSAERSFGVG